MSSLALLLLFLAANTIDGARDKPNILLLLADDMGWGDLGANLPHLPSSTPFLDKLANSGIRFQDFHSGSSVCTPSRSALLTGRLGQRTGVLNNFGPDSVGGLPETEITIAKILKEAGYRTAALGKWHLGLTQGHHPLDHGFDRYFGVPYSLDMGCSVPPGLDMPPKRSCIRNLNNGSKEFSNTPLPLYKDRDILHQPVKLADLAQLYAEFGTNFVNEDKNVPFFLLVAFSHVHVPLAHGNNFSNATNGGVFENCLREMDWIAEELVRAAGLENTLIWFLSDNGPWQSKCNLAGSAGPYKGVWQQYNAGGSAKRTVWEGGHRVPAFINWAPVIKVFFIK
ncbi:Hypothetical predicted protein [Cloeon dipterum]|uniref:Sulfatase N-terminal domain-containing protein n=1 Tax=Cloeon dipterum TaxID=197152 RepID=A0A8S1CV67_9INSE|nr:Hypothetical predicted protein [Cloeon dipterum]